MSQSLTQLRQSMTWLHTWSGLVLGWLLFFIFLTGTLGYFDTEIDRWMKPELPEPVLIGQDIAASEFNYVQAIDSAISHAKEQAKGAVCWNIGFPKDRNDPYLRLFFRGADTSYDSVPYSSNRLLIEPQTGEIYSHRDTGGGQLLYKMHWKLHYVSTKTGEWIVGIASIFMLVALISGIIIHKRFFKDFFLFTQNKGKRSWLEAHKLVGVIALPFHLMITYTGLVYLMLVYMPLMVTAFYGDDESKFLRDTTASSALIDKAHQPATLTDVSALYLKAQKFLKEEVPNQTIKSACVRSPGDVNARVVFRTHGDSVLEKSFHAVVYDGVTGEFIKYEPAYRSEAKTLQSVLKGLHEGTFASLPLRWLFFLSGLLGTAMIATGLILWARRQSQKLGANAENHRGLWWVERLNVTTIIGLTAAIGMYFVANRLLPLEMVVRAQWEVHVMFISWVLFLIHALVRPLSRLWFEQATIAALIFLSLPFLNMALTERGLQHSIEQQDWTFVVIDLSFWVTAGLFIHLVQLNWKKHKSGLVSPSSSLKANSDGAI